jgi:hypothetical protein
VVEQAKGVLAERLDIGDEDAFEILRFAARCEQVRVRSPAADGRPKPRDADADRLGDGAPNCSGSRNRCVGATPLSSAGE